MLGTSKSISGFDPRTIPGCQVWLDAADTSSITLSGSSVTQWNDKSGNGKHAVAGGTTPTYSSATKSIVFGGAGYFTNSSLSLPLSTRSVFIVCRQTSRAADFEGIMLLSSPSVSETDYDSATTIPYFASGSNPTVGDTAFSIYNRGNYVHNYRPYILTPLGIYVDIFGSLTGTLYINGTSSSTDPDSSSLGTANGYILGARKFGGTTLSTFFNGNIYEILVYNTALTTSERQQVEGYLAHKWGLVPYYDSSIPLTIPGCQLWLDGADPAGTGVIPSDGTLATWVDKSGNGRNGVQFSTFTRPQFVANSLNSRGGVSFNAASSNCYQTQSVLPTPGTIFVVGFTSDGGFCLSGIPNPNSGHPPYYVSFARDVEFGVNNTSDTAFLANVSTSFNTNYILTGLYTGSNVSVIINGGTLSNTVSFSGTPKTPATTLIGLNSYANGLGAALTGTINEMITYNTALTTSQRQQMEGYLARKWGFASMYSSVPSIHPFYSVRPHLRAFHPTDIDGCQLWLDAADSSTVTLSGSNVTQIVDKSSNAYTFTGSAGSYPTRTTTLNGLPVISSATGQYLQTTSFNQNFTTATFFAVVRPTEDITPNGKSGNGYAAYGIASGTQLGDLNFVVTYANQSQTGDPSKFFIEIDKQGTAFINGALGGASPSNYNPVNTPLNIGAVLSGSSNTNSAYLNGNSVNMTYNVSGTFPLQSGRTVRCFSGFGCDFAETLIYGTVLTTSQRQQVEGYLAHKWGLTPTYATNTPLTIPGCTLWLDGADPLGNGVIPSDGTSISPWYDKSVSGYNAIIVNNPAVLKRNIQNSNSVMRFNSTRYSVTYPSFPSTGYTFFVVMYLSTNSGSYQRIINGSFSDQYLFIGTNSGSIATFNGNGTWNDINANWPPITNFQTWRIVTVTVGSSVLTPYVDGTRQDTKTGTTAAFSNLYIGDSGQHYFGDIGEILVYNSVLTTSQRQTIEAYLARKWGLTVSGQFLSTHPFKSIPPASIPTLPVAVSSVTLTSLSTSDGTISWASTNATGYIWYIGTGQGSGQVTSGFVTGASTITTTVTYTFVVDTTYYAWVIPYNLDGLGPTTISLSATVSASTSTGGTIVSSGGVTYHVFTSSDSLSVTGSRSMNYLLVGGGGGGGDRHGGGGGAGGVLSGSWTATTGTYTVTVGLGGEGGSFQQRTGGQNPQGAGFKGGNSSLSGTGISQTAYGGGGGGTYGGNPSGTFGSGGGGGGNSLPGIAGTSGQGNSGGAGSSSTTAGGGGGGAGGAGVDAEVSTGGDGTSAYSSQLLAAGYGTTFAVPTSPNTVISDGVAYIAGGGGGGSGVEPEPGGRGGLGGGGRGDWDVTYISTGTPNTGGGGGGSRSRNEPSDGVAGGSGLVLIWY
jgi:hypothetical protein